MVNSPVAYIVFNRPEITRQSFAVIREQRPKQLFIIADGPRESHESDLVKCAEVRDIVDNVDWDCEVHHNYAEQNMGLKNRVSSGLDWVFNQVEEAMILEDDCIAHPDFFSFCNALLERYREENKVAVITGNNFQQGRWRGEASYYFSKYNHCWGWATWRRSWQKYDGDLTFWPEWKTTDDYMAKLPSVSERRYWGQIFDKVKAKKIDSWAYPWTASVWHYGGLTASPNVNLVSNIGFGEDATHTKDKGSASSRISVDSLSHSLVHPNTVIQHLEADKYVFSKVFSRSWKSTLKNKFAVIYQYLIHLTK